MELKDLNEFIQWQKDNGKFKQELKDVYIINNGEVKIEQKLVGIINTPEDYKEFCKAIKRTYDGDITFIIKENKYENK